MTENSHPIPPTGALLGIDYGTKRVGVAVSDSGQIIASPLRILQKDAAITTHLATIVEEHGVVGLVVGLPVHMSGDEGEKAGEAREFGGELGSHLQLPVVYHDERFTTKMANAAMANAGLSSAKRKARVDMVAAQMMLQAFLESDCPSRDGHL